MSATIEVDESGLGYVEERRDLMRRAFGEYLNRLRVGGLEPALNPLPYNFDRFGLRVWRMPFGAALVKDELRDLTNLLNRWYMLLQKWQAWNAVLATFGENEAWALRYEFIESDAHQCLTFPSSIRDAIAFVATNGVHQLRMANDGKYEDRLDGDPSTPTESHVWLSRRKRESQLSRLVSPWGLGKSFIQALRALDDRAYRLATLDYRNEFSHAIAPSLEVGETRFVTRSVRQATEMARQVDGTSRDENVPGKTCVSYSIGGRPPLDMEASRAANLAQYLLARECFSLYVSILDASVASVAAVEDAHPKAGA